MALSSAIVWAIAVILFRISGYSLHPISLNLGKNLFALTLIALTLVIRGNSFAPPVPTRSIWLLLLSGFLGIAVSDTLFLWTLKLLGASLTAIVDSVYSPFVIGLSYFFLGERLSWRQLIGVIFIVSAVITITRTNSDQAEKKTDKKSFILGIIMGTIAMALVAIAIIIIKPVLNGLPVVWATGVRLLGGTLPLLVIPIIPSKRKLFSPLFNLANWKFLAPASFFGTYMSLIFWIGGMKYAFASIAAALNQLSTIFIFILAATFLKEKVTVWRIFAVIMAVFGAFLTAY